MPTQSKRRATQDSVLDAQLRHVFGHPTDSMAVIAERARRAFPGRLVIVWEGDPQTFQFQFVSPDATTILGYPVERWTTEPTFWADVVVHPDDRDNAISYCALATGKGADHIFEYRAITATQTLVWLRDFVHVVPGPRGIPHKLRGLMFDVTPEKEQSVAMAPQPAPEELRLGEGG